MSKHETDLLYEVVQATVSHYRRKADTLPPSELVIPKGKENQCGREMSSPRAPR